MTSHRDDVGDPNRYMWSAYSKMIDRIRYNRSIGQLVGRHRKPEQLRVLGEGYQ